MCRAGERHCVNWGRLRKRAITDFAPESREGVPDVAWAHGESRIDVAELWEAADANGGAGLPGGPGRAEVCAALLRCEQDKVAETQITTDVIACVTAGEGELAGLGFRMKSPTSMARKIALTATGRIDKSGSPLHTQIAASLTDTIRYTDEVRSPDQLVGEARTVAQNLRQRGYRIVEAESFYAEGAVYKGLHTTVETPEGLRFELQFHSKESLEVKEGPEGIHVFYEHYRQSWCWRDRRGAEVSSACWDECVRRSRKVRMPPGMKELNELGGCEVKHITPMKPQWYIDPQNRKEYTERVRLSDLSGEERRLGRDAG